VGSVVVVEQGRRALVELQTRHPPQAAALQEVIAELTHDYPGKTT
jgi:hypothetical protein